MPEAHPPRTDPPVDLVRQVWGFRDGASQIVERGCLSILLPCGVEVYLRSWCREIGMHGSPSCSLGWSGQMRPRLATKTAIIRSNPRGDRDTMLASSAYNTPQIARHTHSSAVPGPAWDGCSCRWVRSASMSASSQNRSSATRSISLIADGLYRYHPACGH